jgi:hypothetical protein
MSRIISGHVQIGSTRPLIPRHRGGELALHVDVDILRDVVDDLDDAAAGEREPPLVLAADGIATVVADAETSPQSA